MAKSVQPTITARFVDTQTTACKACWKPGFMSEMTWGRLPPFVGMMHPHCAKTLEGTNATPH